MAASSIFAAHRHEMELANAIMAATPLDAVRELVDDRTWLVLTD